MATPPGYADISVKIQHSTLTRPAYVTYGCNPTSTDPVVVAGLAKAAWIGANSINSLLDNEATATEFIARLGTDGGEDIIGSVASTTPGAGATGASLPPNCAVLIHKRTARGGRRGRGRMFMPWFVSEGNVGENGQLTTTIVNSTNTVLTTWLGFLNSGDHPMVVFHTPSEDPAHPAGPPDVVTSLSADPLISTQRRRLGR